jgi:hypothetical protein
MMAKKLKTFVTNFGFYELAVATPSMAAALRAWGLTHNAFDQDLARQTDDPKIIAAAEASPGQVLRRPIGSKGPFTADAPLPGVKGSRKKKAEKPKPDPTAIKEAEAALDRAKARHDKKMHALADEREKIDRQMEGEEESWQAEREQLKADLASARHPK